MPPMYIFIKCTRLRLNSQKKKKKKTHILLVHPLQIPAACTLHGHHWSSNYDDTQSPTLFQYTPPLSPLSRLTLQLDEHRHSNYKTAGQLHMERTVQLLAYKCSLDVFGCIPAGTLKLNAKIVPMIAMTFIIICS